ncbi:uncharacterized protein LOC106076561 [Biomphalaria glabrata]|uniref:Uncharacterized protein LOC106076561 n=1 Tax=Biomphalaria glabrata TaxID=6526 RepID=A0A9W2YKP2_BIOGL|nr:uncharacterized protein LOC106076561 [Biomphalaria glabrata]XP_055863240.1 uncharacterized protein LOC106076561 [Biomphalaria glabrata]
MQPFAQPRSRNQANYTLNDKKQTSHSKDCVSCGSLQTDLEFEIDGRRFKFNHDLTASILHTYYRKFNMVEKKTVKVQLIKLSSNMLNEFVLSKSGCCINYSWYTENVLELWDAARLLKVPSLIRICEANVGQIFSEDNFESIYTKAHLYKSDIVLNKAKEFLVRFFQNNKKGSQLMKDWEVGVIRVLTYEDILYLVKEWPFRPDMSDDVLKSIFNWTENYDNRGPCSSSKNDDLDMSSQKTRDNDLDMSSQKIRDYDKVVLCTEYEKFENKSSILYTLLKDSKYRSASLECLQELSRHGMCQRDQEAKLLINEAISCKLDKNTHGYWFPSQLYGNLQNYRHIGVLADKDRVSIMYLDHSFYNWRRLSKCLLHSTITNLTVFDNELYAISSTGLESLIFVFRNEEWKFVLDLPNKNFVVVSKGEFIYVIDGTSSSVKCVSPRGTPVLHSEIKFPDMMRNPESALDFDRSILIFCSTDSDERSTVFCLDVPEHKWTYCGHLEGSAKYLVGFRNETNYFILQRDGSISQVLRKLDDWIEFIFIKRLWSFQSALRGAFIYSDELYIFSNTPVESLCFPGVSGVFSKIQYWYQEKEACNFVRFIMPFEFIRRSEHLLERLPESNN